MPPAAGNRTCCCWTNRPTTWTPSPWPGWNASCTTSKAPWWRSPTTVTSWITWPAGSELDRGEGIPWEGNYSSWLEQKDARLAQEASAEAARRKSIEKELEWVRQGAKGRQSKGKARLARFEELNNTEYQKRNETNELFIPPAHAWRQSGRSQQPAQVLRRPPADRRPVVLGAERAIVGIIGPNGAGKSTLFRMMSGQEQPDSGSIVLGDTVKLASVDQFRDSMDGSKTVWEEVSGGQDIMRIGNTEMPSRAYVGRFNFKGVDQANAWASCPAVSVAVCTCQAAAGWRQRAAAR
ncbi:ATP-binding cassette domain-containing protein [Serratia ureilytica]